MPPGANQVVVNRSLLPCQRNTLWQAVYKRAPKVSTRVTASAQQPTLSGAAPGLTSTEVCKDAAAGTVYSSPTTSAHRDPSTSTPRSWGHVNADKFFTERATLALKKPLTKYCSFRKHLLNAHYVHSTASLAKTSVRMELTFRRNRNLQKDGTESFHF